MRLGTISRIWPRSPFSLVSTRARGTSGALPTDLLERREPPRRQMVLSTLELERSARPTMTNAASPGRGGAGEVGGERSELRGHRSTPAKFCSSDSGCLVSFFLRCPVGAQRAARNDQQNLAAFTILASLYARARNKRRAADGLSNNRKQGDCYPIALAEALSLKSPIPKERLRVSNWIVQRLYNYAVNETVEL